jgi:uncharacterized protein (DUF1810 family)
MQASVRAKAAGPLPGGLTAFAILALPHRILGPRARKCVSAVSRQVPKVSPTRIT